MDWKKIAPWNWFKHENEENASERPVAQSAVSRDLLGVPTSDFDRLLRSVFDRSFAGFPSLESTWPSSSGQALRPKMDIAENEEAYEISAELPGVDPSDVIVEFIHPDRLMLRAEKKHEKEDEKAGYHCIERSYGAVQRVLSLPEDADSDSIEARFRNGVLDLKIPKQATRSRSGNRIEIQSA